MAANCEDLVGKVIRRITTDSSGNILTIVFQDDTQATFETYADCCSSTWIEHLETPPDIDGATFMGVEEKYMGVLDTEDEYECIQSYETTFITSAGHVSVEYRNSSNGYYGGSLERVGGPQ